MGGSTKLNATSSEEIEKRLEQINETLSSISAKEVLFIITLSFLSMFVLLILCLQIIEKRKKRKQNSVPQSIVIQPTNVKGDKSGRHDKKFSASCETDVLPSKSMKMKVAISPTMSAARKARSISGSSVSEDSQVSRTESSRVDSSRADSSRVVAPPQQPVEKKSEPDVATAVESLPVDPSKTPTSAPAPPTQNQNASNSQSNDSIASFTVPAQATTQSPANLTNIFPKPATPSTPTATTLSGSSALSASSEGPKVDKISMATAKDLSAKSPMTPVRTPEVLTAPAPPTILPNVFSTPPPASEKKVDSLFPNGCGSYV